jgi:hypothetical protein
VTDFSALTLNGSNIASAIVYVPAIGVWFADCTYVDTGDISGSATIQIGDTTLIGTIDDLHSGTFGAKTFARVVGGGGGWSTLVAERSYANDAGVKAKLVLADAARECGERLDVTSFTPGVEKLGVAYTRPKGLASVALEDAARGADWRVDYDGITRVGARQGATTGQHLLLSWDPSTLYAELACDSLTAIQIGAVIPASEILPQSVTIQSLEVHITTSGLRVRAWCGESHSTPLLDTFRSLVERIVAKKLFGKYHYRVIRMNGDRVDLQPVKRSSGMPTLVTVSMWPGVSGFHARLTPGTECAVEFLDGDRARPIVTAFTGRGGPNAIPQSIDIGGPNGALAARQGDTVEILLPPCIASGTIAGVGTFTAVLTFPISKTLGSITTGSAKNVRIE